MVLAPVIALVAAASPAVQVCIRPLSSEPCQVAPVPVEADIVPYGVGGKAKLRWLVDGEAVRMVEVELVAGTASRNLLLLEPRRERHRVALEVRIGSIVATGVADVAPPICPFDLAMDGIEVAPGRRIRLEVVNRGPSPSGPWVLHLTAAGAVLYRSPMPSLEAGERYELDVPWSGPGFEPAPDVSPAVGRLDPYRGRRRIRVDVESTPGDLDRVNDTVEFFAPDP